MDFKSVIYPVLIAGLNFLVKSAITALTDTVESKDNFKKRIVKYSKASLFLVCFYFICYYFMTKTSKFNFTSEDGVALLICFVTSILFFYLNGNISTLVKALITKRKPKETDKRALIWGSMFVINLLMFLIIIMVIPIFIRQNNYINEDTRATLTMGSKEYEIVIPKDTLFAVESSTQNQKNNNPLDEVFDFQADDTEYRIKKGTSITLLEGTFLLTGQEFPVNVVNNKELSDVNFYTNDKTEIKLIKKKTVELAEDSVVLRRQKSSYLTVATVTLCVQTLVLAFYYLMIIGWAFLVRVFQALIRKWGQKK